MFPIISSTCSLFPSLFKTIHSALIMTNMTVIFMFYMYSAKVFLPSFTTMRFVEEQNALFGMFVFFFTNVKSGLLKPVTSLNIKSHRILLYISFFSIYFICLLSRNVVTCTVPNELPSYPVMSILLFFLC